VSSIGGAVVSAVKPLELVNVAPTGREMVRGFGHRLDGSPIYEWEEDVYPPSPEGRRLRDLRIELGLGLRESCALLEITAVQLSSLERGRATCDWAQAERMLRDGKAVGL
jgi:hypothetical protein